MSNGMKLGAREGGGPEPGNHWNALCLDHAKREAEKILTPEQYEHGVDLVKQLVQHADPTHSDTLSIRAVEDFWEIRDKGGVLGNLNLRIFFAVDKANKAIVVLSVIKKQNDGPTPLGDKVRVRYRWRKYNEGVYGMATAIVKQKEKE